MQPCLVVKGFDPEAGVCHAGFIQKGVNLGEKLITKRCIFHTAILVGNFRPRKGRVVRLRNKSTSFSKRVGKDLLDSCAVERTQLDLFHRGGVFGCLPKSTEAPKTSQAGVVFSTPPRPLIPDLVRGTSTGSVTRGAVEGQRQAAPRIATGKE